VAVSPVQLAATGFLGDLPVSCSWGLGPLGPFYSGLTPTVQFPEAGIFGITLVVTDADGDVVTFVRNVTVGMDLYPSIIPTWPQPTIELGKIVSVSISATTGNGLDKVIVNFGNGDVKPFYSLPDHIDYVYEEAGTFTWSIEIYDTDGDVARASLDVTVMDWSKITGPILLAAIVAGITVFVVWGKVAGDRGYWLRPPRRIVPKPPEKYVPHVTIGQDRVLVADGGVLDVSNKGLRRLVGIGGIDKAYAYVRSLDVSGNDLDSLEGLAAFTKVRVVRARGNRIQAVKKADVPESTITLDLADNHLTQVSLPTSTALRDLDLSNNDLEDLPGLGGASQLIHIKLDGNKFLNGLIEALGGMTDDGFAKDPRKILAYGLDRAMRHSIRLALQMEPGLPGEAPPAGAPLEVQPERKVRADATIDEATPVDRWPLSLIGIITGLRRRINNGGRAMSLAAITDACAVTSEVDKSEVERLLGLLVKGDVLSRRASEFRLGDVLRIAGFWDTIDKLHLGQDELAEALEMLSLVGAQQKLGHLRKMYHAELE
jgi:hypothetical protein